MTMWLWILAACAIAYATKLVGYLLPERWLESPWVTRLSHGVTVGLLASLVATNAFVKDAWGAAFSEQVSPAADDIVLEGKRGLDAFASTLRSS